MQYPEVISLLKKYASENQPLYLVGGAVRDYILSKPCNDFDIACSGDARTIARKFANENDGSFYMLDEERNTCRVLVDLPTSGRAVIDFAKLRGETIEADLAERDFTINAMAVNLLNTGRIIDPFKGERDLQEKWLRPVRTTSFQDDPLRTIRAVRYAVCLGLKIEPGTTTLVDTAVSGLVNISAERKRDELFKVLDEQDISTSLLLLRRFRVFEYFPLQVKADFTGAVRQARTLEEIIDWLTGRRPPEKQAAFYQASLLLELGRFKDHFKDHFLRRNPSGRNRKTLLQLILLLDDHLADLQGEGLKPLALSVEERGIIQRFKGNIDLINNIIQQKYLPTPIENYHFYKKTGSTGIDLAIAALADYVTQMGADFSQSIWLERVKTCKILIETWYEKPEWVNPIPLLDGNEIMELFHLEPGPQIGVLLEELKQEQVKEVVRTKTEAMKWVEKKLI